jgi:hypothetical protein
MVEPTHGDLYAEIAALRAVTETELKNLSGRMAQVEITQRELVSVATQGKTGLRVFLWLGGFLTAGATVLTAIWSDLFGR